MFEKTFSFWRRLVGAESAPASANPARAAQDDRRLWVRYETDLQGSIQLAQSAGSAKVQAKVRDLSVGGANLVVDQALPLGQMLSLELPAGAEIRTVLACVVRVIGQKDGAWSLGCVFSRELNEDELGTLGAQKVQADGSDKRIWVRFDTQRKANYRKVGDPSAQALPAEVLNISANGIGLCVNPSLEAGALLNVDLLDKSGRTVRSILACVVHTTLRASGDYAVGCNFIRELNEDELKSLL